MGNFQPIKIIKSCVFSCLYDYYINIERLLCHFSCVERLPSVVQRIFEVSDDEYEDRFLKFKMAEPIWWTKWINLSKLVKTL